MKKICFTISILFFTTAILKAQQLLPGISVNNLSGKIIVSWKNAYKVPVSTINIQRSYDSLKNYTTIGSVLNPQNTENGYADANPPYKKMYYRVFIAFEGGSYIYSDPVRPATDSNYTATTIRYPWQSDPSIDPRLQVPPSVISVNPNSSNPSITSAPVITFPSKWVYTAKDNNVVIHLPEAEKKKYTAKFYDELEKQIFELTNLKEEFLIIEKVNFVRSGWYRFELFDNGKLVEKNKFFIPKDGKVTNEPLKKMGNK